jgi:GNAT superfamily N-acetyltransferase
VADLASIVELGEAEAYADFFAAAPAELATRYGMHVERIGSATALAAQGVDVMLFNRVMGLGLVEPAAEASVDGVLALYRRAGVQNFAVQVSPAAQPVALADWLHVRGLTRHDNWAKMYRSTEPPPAIQTDLRIERIGAEQVRAFSEIVCDVFGMPEFLMPWVKASVGRRDWIHYSAFDGDKPVVTAALFARNDIGWLGMAATLPSHRGRGAQGALMAQRIRDGVAAGCRWLITETGEDTPQQPNPSYHNMLRTGFKLAYQRSNYMHSP